MTSRDASVSVARRLLLRRASIGKFDLSLVLLENVPIDAVATFLESSSLRIEVILPEAIDVPVGGDSTLAPCARINRALERAAGTILEIRSSLPGDTAETAAAISEFRADPDLGMVGGEGRPVFVRADLWVAAGGLEEGYRSTDFAFVDLHRKALAIGYATRIDPPWSDVTPGGGADGALYHRRWSGQSTGRRVGARRESQGQGVIYTAITANRDTLKPLPAVDAETVAFLDSETRASNAAAGWRPEPLIAVSADPSRAAKFYKILPHRSLSGVRYSLWLDASVYFVAPFGLGRLIELFLRDADICVFRHDRRSCAYEEAEYCAAAELDGADTIESQMDRYRRDGFPRNSGLAELAVVLRRHSDAVRDFNEAWWSEIETGSRRDQLSFPFVAWKTGLPYDHFPLSLGTHNGLFLKAKRGRPETGRNKVR